MRFGAATYRAGALERIHEARLLCERGRLSLAVYVGGLAVEGMLRALCALRDAAFDERHDLKRLALRARDLGLLSAPPHDDQFIPTIEGIARRWLNILRFADQRQFERFVVRLGELREKDFDQQLKPYCFAFVDACFQVLKRCERRWMKSH